MNLNNLFQISKDLNVLYIEDDDSKDSTFELLNDLFNLVIVANDGEEGFSKYLDYYKKTKQYFDIIISDINMPNMDGIELSKKIFSINNKQIFIITSAYNQSDDLIKLINLGITSFIQKPINKDITLNVLYKVCNNISNSNLILEYNNKIEKLNESLKNSNLILEKKVEERTFELENLLYYDKLTKLESHFSLIKNIERSSNNVLFLINLDSFHNINSLYGFDSSNELLIQFSQCLKIFNLKHKYKIFRIYADEFALFAEIKKENKNNFENHLYLLIEEIKKFNFTVNKSEVIDLNVTIGLSISEKNPLMTSSLAMKHAKKHRLSFCIYNKELASANSINDVLTWSKRLKIAIEQNLILPAYQPIVDKNKNILKYEVLMRVAEKNKDTYNIISPYEFLEPAIKTKQYNKMMAILIEKSFITMYNRKEDFSINLSYQDIYNRTLIDIIKDNLRKFKRIGNRLIIEILETESIEDLEIMRSFIKEVRAFGVRIAIDDFGTGHSNFTNIIDIDPDYLKIDGSFIKNIDKDPKSYSLVKSIIISSKELNIKTIAEFVHKKDIFDILVELEVDEFQGYYFSEPLLNI